MKSLACIVGSTVFVAACVNPVTITQLDSSDPGAGSSALDISDTGHIAGSYDPRNGYPRQAAAFEPNGQVVLLPLPPGYAGCGAVAVANDGRIAGNCTRGSTAGAYLPTAFFAESARSNLQFIPLGANVEGTVLDMNNRGVILGRSLTSADPSNIRYWLYDAASGQLTDVPGLANATTTPSAINDAGDIAGVASIPNGETFSYQLVKWSAGTLAITAAPVPDGKVPSVSRINNRGNIVGTTHDVSTNADNASFWSSVTAAEEPLPQPSVELPHVVLGTYTNAVNDDGWIVGFARVIPIGYRMQRTVGVVWTADRRVIQFGVDTFANAINSSGVVVGRYGSYAARFDLATGG